MCTLSRNFLLYHFFYSFDSMFMSVWLEFLLAWKKSEQVVWDFSSTGVATAAFKFSMMIICDKLYPIDPWYKKNYARGNPEKGNPKFVFCPIGLIRMSSNISWLHLVLMDADRIIFTLLLVTLACSYRRRLTGVRSAAGRDKNLNVGSFSETS